MDIIAAVALTVAAVVAVVGCVVCQAVVSDRERANVFAALLWVAVLALGGAGWTILHLRHGG